MKIKTITIKTPCPLQKSPSCKLVQSNPNHTYIYCVAYPACDFRERSTNFRAIKK